MEIYEVENQQAAKTFGGQQWRLITTPIDPLHEGFIKAGVEQTLGAAPDAVWFRMPCRDCHRHRNYAGLVGARLRVNTVTR